MDTIVFYPNYHFKSQTTKVAVQVLLFVINMGHAKNKQTNKRKKK